MRVVVALGGNALLRRGERMTADVQRSNVRKSAPALAAIARAHQLVLSHGNGPQVGLLALQASSYQKVQVYPLDVLDAQTEGMIGYILEQELGNLLPAEQAFATLLTMVEVDPADPAFENPTKFVGPVYDAETARSLADEKHWVFKQDGDSWRRVVPSPDPKRIFEIRPISWLVDLGTIVICAGGGGIPTMYDENAARTPAGRELSGVEAVIDKDLASELLARDVDADLFLMATDVEGVFVDWGTPRQRQLETVTVDELRGMSFPAGSMGPKVEAATRFVDQTGHRAAIGALEHVEAVVDGRAGTQVVPAGSTATRST
jgi:carbamate kinase